ncbi:MAG TPA: hypothetical protein PKD12_17890 [Nitrospira sp.]|nr:hypothetical protein [Nitrospira sp.]
MTQTKNRRNRPTQQVQFKRMQGYIHPQNIAFLTAESKQTGQSLSGLVNDAVTILRRMYQGEPVL